MDRPVEGRYICWRLKRETQSAPAAAGGVDEVARFTSCLLATYSLLSNVLLIRLARGTLSSAHADFDLVEGLHHHAVIRLFVALIPPLCINHGRLYFYKKTKNEYMSSWIAGAAVPGDDSSYTSFEAHRLSFRINMEEAGKVGRDES
jgi:hypothetical protein